MLKARRGGAQSVRVASRDAARCKPGWGLTIDEHRAASAAGDVVAKHSVEQLHRAALHQHCASVLRVRVRLDGAGDGSKCAPPQHDRALTKAIEVDV